MGRKVKVSHPGQAYGSFRKMLRRQGGKPTLAQGAKLKGLRGQGCMPGDAGRRAEQDRYNAIPQHLR